MLLIRKDSPHFDKIDEYAKSIYEDKNLHLVGENYYYSYSNETCILQEDIFTHQIRMSIGAQFLSDMDMAIIFNSQEFQKLVAKNKDKFTDYSYQDYLLHIVDINSKEYDKSLTYLVMSYIYNSNRPDASKIQFKRSDNIPIFTNEDKTIFSTIALYEFDVNIKVNANSVLLKGNKILYEYNPDVYAVTEFK